MADQPWKAIGERSVEIVEKQMPELPPMRHNLYDAIEAGGKAHDRKCEPITGEQHFGEEC